MTISASRFVTIQARDELGTGESFAADVTILTRHSKTII